MTTFVGSSGDRVMPFDRVDPFGPRRLRFVVYRGIDDADIAHTIAACREITHSTSGTSS